LQLERRRGCKEQLKIALAATREGGRPAESTPEFAGMLHREYLLREKSSALQENAAMHGDCVAFL
jgi:hypothetical protein